VMDAVFSGVLSLFIIMLSITVLVSILILY
jgi:hypothetical protein